MTSQATMFNEGLRQGQTNEWSTPPDFYSGLHHEFGFDLDPCATPGNAKCDRYFTVEDNGLAQPWAPARVFMNPPYGRQVGEWMQKATLEAERGALVVALIPARTETAWWHDWVIGRADEVRFIRGRLRFSGSKVNAPFPSAVVIYRPAGETKV